MGERFVNRVDKRGDMRIMVMSCRGFNEMLIWASKQEEK